MALSKQTLEEVLRTGESLAAILKPPTDDRECDQTIELLDYLLDHGASEENHPLAPLANALGSLIHEYEQAHVPELETSPVERLKYLMTLHGLTQKDLAGEFGSQSVVSEVLSGKRELNKRQIEALSKRFKVSPAVFF